MRDVTMGFEEFRSLEDALSKAWNQVINENMTWPQSKEEELLSMTEAERGAWLSNRSIQLMKLRTHFMILCEQVTMSAEERT